MAKNVGRMGRSVPDSVMLALFIWGGRRVEKESLFLCCLVVFMVFVQAQNAKGLALKLIYYFILLKKQNRR